MGTFKNTPANPLLSVIKPSWQRCLLCYVTGHDFCCQPLLASKPIKDHPTSKTWLSSRAPLPCCEYSPQLSDITAAAAALYHGSLC